ncbi:MAG: Fe2+-dependent dioxygenase, partial [Betaproteobacteria bacterium]|nr:Fe2+-dependent dioxygenase [Betaproteobacteria bacterium]
MLLIVPAILKPDELALARSWLAEAPFVDGKLSAGAAARRVKENEERDRNAADVERLDRLVMGALARHPAYRNGALPLHAASPLYARYRPGMTYGEHLDDPIMGTGGVLYRSDVAVTVFLSDPGAYDGGELVIRTAAGEHSVK